MFVVNKADLPGASDARRDLELMLELGHVTGQEDPTHRPPIVMIDSIRGTGIGELVDAIDAHRELLDRTGRRLERRRRRVRFELRTHLALAADAHIEQLLDDAATEQAVADIARGDGSLTSLSARLAAQLFSRGR